MAVFGKPRIMAVFGILFLMSSPLVLLAMWQWRPPIPIRSMLVVVKVYNALIFLLEMEYTNQPMQERPGQTLDCRMPGKLADLPLILKIRTSFLQQHSDILMDLMKNVVFTEQRMVEKPGRKFYTKMRTQEPYRLRLIRITAILFMPTYGQAGLRPGRMENGMAKKAAFLKVRMVAIPGKN